MTMRIGKLLLLVITLSLSLGATAQENIIDEIIWVVGDEAILKSDVEKSRLEMQARGERLKGDPYCFIPEQLAMQKLFLDQAKVDSIKVGDSDVNRSVTMHEREVIANLGSKEKAEEYLKAPMTQLREEWRDDMKNNYLIQQAQNGIMGKGKALTPSEVRKFYSELPKDSLPYIPTSVEVQIITTRPIVPLAETDRIKARLRDFTNRVQNGETSFSTLAIMYSEDPGSATNGGELGFMGRAQLLPEFANVAFALSDANRVSNIVETESGFHIIQLIERRGDRANFRHILLRPNVPTEQFELSSNRLDSIASDIRADKFTFEEGAMLSSDKDTRKTGGLMINQSRRNYGLTSRFAMEELAPEIATAVNTMKIGEISKPFKMMEHSGKQVVAIVKLKARVEGHVANVSDDYQTLKEIVEYKKKDEVLKKWMTTKINETYVRINTNWANCDFQYSGWVKTEDKQ